MESKIEFIWKNLPLEKSALPYTNIYIYYFKVQSNKSLTCMLEIKLNPLCILGISLNEGKLK